MVRKIRVKVRGYYKPSIRKRVRGFTYLRRDVGAPGRGKKVIPELEEGKMNEVAQDMGYERVVDIPNRRLREFARRLIRRYGERVAFGMAQAQVVFRKRGLPHLAKFKKIRKAIAEEMKKTPGWQ
jgi:hypothetical protein